MGGQVKSVGKQKKQGKEVPAAYGRVFDHLLEGCQIISREYRYLYVNDVVARQGKSTREALIGHTMMECYPGIETTEMFARLKECIEDGVAQRMENKFTFPDSTVGWFELRMEPLPEGAIILSIDITDRIKAEERRKLLEELKTTFVRVVSNQLRAPLGTVRGSLETLRGAAPEKLDTEERVHLLAANNAAIEVVERLNEMVDAVDTVSGSAALPAKRISFEELWAPVYAECKAKSMAEHVQLIYAPPSAPLPLIECDPDKIKLVLIGLADNALRYTASGKITVVIDHQNGHIRFQIADTGIGLPVSEQPNVFNRFFRGSNARRLNPEGTGLSLAVARYHVERHGGRIGFTSEQNRGSTFWFEVPVHTAS